jgi:hypothetical protein
MIIGAITTTHKKHNNNNNNNNKEVDFRVRIQLRKLFIFITDIYL